MPRSVLDFWPLGAAIASVVIQGDVLIATSRTWRAWFGIDLVPAIVVVIAVTTMKMCWSFWFWGWVRELVADTQRFQRLATIARQAARLVKGEGLLDRALAALQVGHEEAQQYGHRLLRMTKWAACAFLFGAGSYPLWGTRAPLLAGAGLIRFREGLYALLLGNAIRTVYLMAGLFLIPR